MFQTSIHCPHCREKKVAATVRSVVPIEENHVTIFATCNMCHNGFSMLYETSKYWHLEKNEIFDRERIEHLGNRTTLPDDWVRLDIWPKPPAPRMVEHLAEPVRKALAEAEANFTEGRTGSAAIGYRRTLERCLKLLYPDQKGSLYAQIKELHKNAVIPEPMIDLLNEVRFLGNDGAHDMEDPSLEEVAVGRDFTHLLLVYLVELPKRVELASEARSKD